MYRRRSRPVVFGIAHDVIAIVAGIATLGVCVLLAADSYGARVARVERQDGHPLDGVNRIELRELWRAGSADSDVVFGFVGNALVTTDGGIAVLDYQQGVVFVFSGEGSLEKVVNLLGEGPGGLRYPSDPIRLADGRIAVAQSYPAKIEVFGDDWIYAQTIPLYSRSGSEELRLESLMAYGDGYLVTGELLKKEMGRSGLIHRRINYVNILSSAGILQNAVYLHERVVDFSNYVYVEDDLNYVQNVAIGAAGEIYIPTKRNGYEIGVYNSDGELLDTWTRDYQPLERTEEEIEYAEATRRAVFERTFARYRIQISKYEPDIKEIECGVSGELRITTSRSYVNNDADVFCTYDIFSERGVFMRQDAIILPKDEDRSGRMRWLKDGRLMLITGLADAVKTADAAKEKTQKALGEYGDELYAEPTEIVIYEVNRTSRGR